MLFAPSLGHSQQHSEDVSSVGVAEWHRDERRRQKAHAFIQHARADDDRLHRKQHEDISRRRRRSPLSEVSLLHNASAVQLNQERLAGHISEQKAKRQHVRSVLSHEIQSLLARDAPLEDDATLEDRAWERDFLEDDDLHKASELAPRALPVSDAGRLVQQNSNKTASTDSFATMISDSKTETGDVAAAGGLDSAAVGVSLRTIPEIQPESVYSEDYPRDDDVVTEQAVEADRLGASDGTMSESSEPPEDSSRQEAMGRRRREDEREQLAREGGAADALKAARHHRDTAREEEMRKRAAEDLRKRMYSHEHSDFLRLEDDLESEEDALAKARARRDRLANLTSDAIKALRRATSALLLARKAHEEQEAQVSKARQSLRNSTEADHLMQQKMKAASDLERHASQELRLSEERVRKAEQDYKAAMGSTESGTTSPGPPAAAGQQSDAQSLLRIYSWPSLVFVAFSSLGILY